MSKCHRTLWKTFNIIKLQDKYHHQHQHHQQHRHQFQNEHHFQKQQKQVWVNIMTKTTCSSARVISFNYQVYQSPVNEWVSDTGRQWSDLHPIRSNVLILLPTVLSSDSGSAKDLIWYYPFLFRNKSDGWKTGGASWMSPRIKNTLKCPFKKLMIWNQCTLFSGTLFLTYCENTNKQSLRWSAGS